MTKMEGKSAVADAEVSMTPPSPRQIQIQLIGRALSRQSIRAVDSNGFLSKQTAPAAAARGSSPGSARAVIMMTGALESQAVSSRLRSSPLIPGICRSVMTQSHERLASFAIKSSADAYPNAPYPSEPSASTSAVRNGSSSSITDISSSLDTHLPFPREWPPTAGEPRITTFACDGGRLEAIHRCYILMTAWV